ncbi:putative amidoligase domain-containing protein, partial [Thermocrinis sp.]|uniref:putative amidoligase domain-containing protein n=1 Tax=Thermocrinis sp. TaxID=2024383 RepID=UPI003C05AF70
LSGVYEEREGLYYAVPHEVGRVLNWKAYSEFGHQSIVVVNSNEVKLYNLVGYPEEPEWAVFWAYEGSYEEEEALDLPFVADIPMKGVLILEGCATGRRILVVLKEVWEDPDQFKKGGPLRELLLREGFAFLSPPSFKNSTVLLGGDPEFEVVDLNKGAEIVPASEVEIFEKGSWDPFSIIGTDGCSAIAELRPSPWDIPEYYVDEVRDILEIIKERAPEVVLSVKGDKFPLGGHIHVGARNEFIRKILKNNVRVFIEALDDFIGKLLLPTSGAARGKYAVLSAYEIKPHGWEYRTPPASIYGDMETLRITYKLTQKLVEKLLREGELSYEVGEDGIPPFEEYLAFLTEEEARYFLDFPRRWKEGEVCPFLLLPKPVILGFSGGWEEEMKEPFRAILDLPVKKLVRIVLYSIPRGRGNYFAIPTAPEKWRLEGEFPRAPFVDDWVPTVQIGVPWEFRMKEVIPNDLLNEFISWVKEYLAQLELLAAPVAAE